MEDRELSEAIRAKATYHSAPAALRARLQSALGAAAGLAKPARRGSGFASWGGWLGAGAVIASGAVLAMGIALGLGLSAGIGSGLLSLPGARSSAPGAGLTNEIVASHIRSLMGSHLMDVASTDQHTVKPWFNGKVDFSPPVTDLADQGYPLAGGRLDYLDRHAVAALVYRRHAHPINLFVWRESGADIGVTAASEQGYHILQWRHGGMRFAAVSDLNAEELKSFAAVVRQHDAPQ